MVAAEGNGSLFGAFFSVGGSPDATSAPVAVDVLGGLLPVALLATVTLFPMDRRIVRATTSKTLIPGTAVIGPAVVINVFGDRTVLLSPSAGGSSPLVGGAGPADGGAA